MKSEETEFAEITLRLPKPVLDFIARFYGDPKQHILREILNLIQVDLQTLTGQDLAERFNLQQTFKTILGETI